MRRRHLYREPAVNGTGEKGPQVADKLVAALAIHMLGGRRQEALVATLAARLSAAEQ